MLMIGITLGLIAGLTQSVSYIFSRRYVARHRSSPVQLLILGHIVMGVISAIILPWLWRSDLPGLRVYAWPLAAVTGFYLLGQLSFFAALKFSDASRLSPLLALKIVFLALLTAMLLRQPIAIIQWAGIFICVSSAFLINNSGGTLPWRSLLLILSACLFYSLSDMHIKILVDRFCTCGLNTLHSVFLGVCLCYTLAGGLSMIFLPWVGGWSRENLAYATPFALAWLFAMFFLFASFAQVGVVFGNILQSTRGIFSIVIGAVLAKMGLEHIEQKTTRAVFTRRLAAAVLMCLAIILYVSPKWLEIVK
jgi:drug/metabolite transporter (DMT)-like permease